MRQQTLEDDNEIGRYKGTNMYPGKIFKGALNEAPIKVKVSSIPTKQQNIIYRSFSQPAFGDSTVKFFQPSSTSKNFNPGPGNYNMSSYDAKIYSKKGLGNFASSTNLQRLQRGKNHGPGPGAYTLPMKSKKQRNILKNSTNLSVKKQQKTSTSFMTSSQIANTAILSSQFQTRDIFRDEIKKAQWMPGPGRYDFNPQGTFQNQHQQNNYPNKNRMKKSASLMNYNFKSKINRFQQKIQQVPPVGYYKTDNDSASNNHKKPTYYDESSRNRQKSEKMQQKIQKIFQDRESEKTKRQKIGPGTYNAKNQTRAKFFTIKETINDRFGTLKPIYAMAKKLNAENSQQTSQNANFHRTDYISSLHNNNRPADNWNKTTKGADSMFKSNTKRPELILNNKLGPCRYSDKISPAKKSHLINFSRKWVGI